MLRDVRRPSPTFILSVVYSTALPCSALSVIFDDSSPKGGAKTYLRTCIGAFSPLPSGEVAMPLGIDGEGGVGGGVLASPQADPASRLPASRTSPRSIITQPL